MGAEKKSFLLSQRSLPDTSAQTGPESGQAIPPSLEGLQPGAFGPAVGGKDGALDAGGFGRLQDRESKDDAALIRQCLAPLPEARIWLPEETRPGLTDLRLHRVLVSSGKGGRGVVLRAGKGEER